MAVRERGRQRILGKVESPHSYLHLNVADDRTQTVPIGRDLGGEYIQQPLAPDQMTTIEASLPIIIIIAQKTQIWSRKLG